MKKITRIEHDGFIDVRHLHPLNYGRTRVQIYNKIGQDMPTLDEFRRDGLDILQYRMMLSPLTITIHFEDSNWWQYRFNTGFLTDLASVPQLLRSVVDNDGSSIVVPSLPHDLNFSTHVLDFEDSNQLFRQMMRAYGGSNFRIWCAMRAVRSPFGRARYDAKPNCVAKWSHKTAEFMGGAR